MVWGVEEPDPIRSLTPSRLLNLRLFFLFKIFPKNPTSCPPVLAHGTALPLFLIYRSKKISWQHTPHCLPLPELCRVKAVAIARFASNFGKYRGRSDV